MPETNAESDYRTGVFIDLPNLNGAMSKFPDYIIDWDRLKSWLKTCGAVSITVYAVESVYHDASESERLQKHNKFEGFCNMLQTLGYTVRSRQVKDREDGRVLANADAMISYDLRKAFTNQDINKILLFSGSSSFQYAIEDLREEGISVAVVGNYEDTSKLLRNPIQEGDFVDLVDVLKDIVVVKPSPKEVAQPAIKPPSKVVYSAGSTYHGGKVVAKMPGRLATMGALAEAHRQSNN